MQQREQALNSIKSPAAVFAVKAYLLLADGQLVTFCSKLKLGCCTQPDKLLCAGVVAGEPQLNTLLLQLLLQVVSFRL